jgi:anti-sigma factor RsiW
MSDLSCRDVVDFLMDYVAGTVSVQERAVFEAHLAVCPPCVAYLKSYQAIVQLGPAAYEETSETSEANPGPMPEELVSAILLARPREA